MGNFTRFNPTCQPVVWTDGNNAILGTPTNPAVVNPVGNQSNTDTLENDGTATAPAALSNIATIAAPPAGAYRVRVWVSFSGTPGANETRNVSLRNGATAVATFPVVGVANVLQGPFEVERLTMGGANSLTLTAVGNGTLGGVYNVLLTAQKLQ